MHLKNKHFGLRFLTGLAITVLFSLGSSAAAKAEGLSAAEKECARNTTLEMLQRDEVKRQVKEVKKEWAMGVCASGQPTEDDKYLMKLDITTRISAYITNEVLPRCLALSGNPMLMDDKSYAQRQAIIMGEILKAFPPSCP